MAEASADTDKKEESSTSGVKGDTGNLGSGKGERIVSSDNEADDTADGSEEDEEETSAEGLKDDIFIFRPGAIPPHRQMFYQVAK